MNYETCPKCWAFCNLSAHKCEEFEVWLAIDKRKWSSPQFAPDAETAARLWSERYDDERDWVDWSVTVCVAEPGSDDVRRFRVSATMSVRYSAEEVQK